ncbi:MAG: GPR1/FUN34/YaaH family transporter [Ktedonobacteraceae bacterium]
MADVSVERAPAAVSAVANPAPLGLSAFALTTFVLSAFNASLIPAKGAGVFIGLALFYGGLVQLVAGIQEFRTGNTFGATAFCSYGGFWLATGFIFWQGLGVGSATGVGYYLLGWTIFTGMMFLGTLKSTGALITVFGFLFLTFLFLTIGALGGASGMTALGGWLGIITAILAWYTALAQVLSATNSAIKLPLFPMS